MSDQPKPEVSELVKEIAEAIAEALIPNATKDEINWISQIISTSGLADLEKTLEITGQVSLDLEARLEAAERHVEDVQTCLTWKEFKKMEHKLDEARGRLKEILAIANACEPLHYLGQSIRNIRRLATEGGKDG